MYGMYSENKNYADSVKRAINMFENRVFKMRFDQLLVTNYSKKESLKLHKRAITDVDYLTRSLK